MDTLIPAPAHPAVSGESPRWYQRRSVRRVLLKVVVHGLLITIGLALMVPFLWMLSTSLKPRNEIFLFPPKWIPSQFLWNNYPEALASFPFMVGLRNTLTITLTVIIGRLMAASIVAFAFARMRFRGREPLFILLLSSMMLPYHVTLIPTYILFRYLKWLDTFLPLIVPAFLGGGAFYIFLLRQFFMTVPYDYDDSARIDGAGTMGIFWRIAVPMSKPALATVAIFTFLGEWNDFLGPLIYLNSPSKHTLSIVLQFANTGGYGPRPNWAYLMAASLVVMTPCLLLFFFAQRLFIQGVVISGVKG